MSQTGTPANSLFLGLLKAALWQQPCVCVHADDDLWQEVWRIAREQAVEGLVFDAIAELPAEFRPSRPLKIRMATDVAAIEEHNIRLEKTLRKIAGIYDTNRLKYLLLKGVAAGANYPKPLHRKGGDIDLWLAEKDSAAAQAALSLDQTRPEGDARHYQSTLDGIIVENHFRLSHGSSALYRKFDQELLSDAIRLPLTQLEVQGYEVTCPSPTFNVLFMLDHMAFHLVGGLGLRQLCDWARLLYCHRAEIDRQTVARVVEQYEFSRIFNIFGIICMDTLGLPEEYMPLPVVRNKQAEKDVSYVLRLIMDGGNFGRHNSFWHSSEKHLALPALLRRVISFTNLFRDRRKYTLISPTLWRETVRERLRGVF